MFDISGLSRFLAYRYNLGMNKVRNPLTIRALAVGILGLIIITASSAYVALRMGALPWPTVFVTVLSMAVLGKAKGSTLEEINCTHTLMSAGAMVAGGLAFTLPGLSMIAPGEELPLFQIAVIAVTGAVLGTLFTIIFRKTFIEKEKLPYPMGEAAYNTLIAGKEGKGAPLLFTSLGLSAVFTYIRDGLGKIPAVLTLFSGSTLFPSLAIWVSPMAFGIGAIIGPILALVWFLGAIIGYFIITPAGLGLGLFQSMAEADVFRSNLGIGLMIGTGLGVAIKAIISAFRRKDNDGKRVVTGKDAAVILTVAAAAAIMLALFTEITIIEAVLLIIGTYLATYLSGMLTGQTGINPMEIFAILVLLAISAVFSPTLAAAFSIAGVVAVACGLTGDVMNDLKSGSLVGTRPRYQIMAEGIGGIIGALVAAFVIYTIGRTTGFGSDMFPAPQARAVAAMAGGLENHAAFFAGAAIGILLFLLRLPSATLGLGVYLPTYISSAMALGAVIMAACSRIFRGKAEEKAALISSGLLGGEGITGVIIAIFMMF